MYNRIPTGIKQLESFKDFKQELKLFLLDRPFLFIKWIFYILKRQKNQ
jgi:hypothetical protein